MAKIRPESNENHGRSIGLLIKYNLAMSDIPGNKKSKYLKEFGKEFGNYNITGDVENNLKEIESHGLDKILCSKIGESPKSFARNIKEGIFMVERFDHLSQNGSYEAVCSGLSQEIGF